MKHQNLKVLIAALAMISAILACGSPSATESPATQPPESVIVSVTDTASPPTEVAIQHQIVPVSLPENRSDHAGDYDSSKTAKEKMSNGGDRFSFERFERPFNANTMDVYFPELDILDTYVYDDDTWIYGTIQVVDRSAAKSSPYRFAMQIDTEVDGKGDYLVIAENPSSTDWTTVGVQMFFDENSDVGDLTAMLTDPDAKTDGFEKMIFDQGRGDDPDSAWVRVSPKDSNTVEIAVKRSVIGSPPLYMVDMWSGHATLDPAMFDFSDHYTHEQAGAADPGLPNFYPIKSVFEIDNSCRIAVGFQPTGLEPGLCQSIVPVQVGPGTPAPTACQRPPTCFGCGYTWDQATCTCSQVAC